MTWSTARASRLIAAPVTSLSSTAEGQARCIWRKGFEMILTVVVPPSLGGGTTNNKASDCTTQTIIATQIVISCSAHHWSIGASSNTSMHHPLLWFVAQSAANLLSPDLLGATPFLLARCPIFCPKPFVDRRPDLWFNVQSPDIEVLENPSGERHHMRSGRTENKIPDFP
ncbi:hypothetical protein MUK42_28555 [Musa troglodytarum]|uniref:Uncharacterized protein n=1 Tax=Musa troglodytarum TaxID=320322 RepID=A0A9E7G2X5_9LILI|nr:hypothetical protein MUK42_28555 [Musa troglodytarum]